jgi:hypothetical protein
VVEVRRCSVVDVAEMRRIAAAGLRHHEQRFAAQERGWCDFLLAVDDRGSIVGHVVVRTPPSTTPSSRAAV